MRKSKLSSKEIARSGLLFALCIGFQFLKNTSVYITGPVVNAILIVATLSCGTWTGIILSILSPITSWLITQSPLMTAMPWIIPAIMVGNLIMVLATYIAKKGNAGWRLPVCLGIGSLAKGAFLYSVIVRIIFVLLGPSTGLPEKVFQVAKTTFSVTQVITALIGSLIAWLLWSRIKLALRQK